MIKTIIIDDEPLARLIIMEYLKQYDDIEIVAECGDGFQGAKAIQQHQPDLVFLDIQMPKLTGFEMLEILDEMPNVIFTTAFDEYAIKAFEKNAVDYLLKPISKDRFEQGLSKFRNAFANQNNGSSTTTTVEKVAAITEEESLERIVVKMDHRSRLSPSNRYSFWKHTTIMLRSTRKTAFS